MVAVVFFPIVTNASEQFVDLSASTDLKTAQEILQEVIEEEGLIPGQPNHLSEMMERTGPALNKTKPVFREAIVIPFCSSRHSWMLTEEDPRQLTLCPFSIGLYVLPTAPSTVHISYRSPGDGSTALLSAELLLKKIATTTQLRLQGRRSAD
jgi:hypothetical protein